PITDLEFGEATVTTPRPAHHAAPKPAEPPPKPDDVREEIAQKQHQAEVLRQRLDDTRAQEQHVEHDVAVARELETERKQEYQELRDQADNLEARAKDVEDDARVIS